MASCPEIVLWTPPPGSTARSTYFSCGELRPCPEHDMPCDDCRLAIADCECEAVSDDPWDNGGEDSWAADRDERAGS